MSGRSQFFLNRVSLFRKKSRSAEARAAPALQAAANPSFSSFRTRVKRPMQVVTNDTKIETEITFDEFNEDMAIEIAPVQTCLLYTSLRHECRNGTALPDVKGDAAARFELYAAFLQIGRASCRERV